MEGYYAFSPRCSARHLLVKVANVDARKRPACAADALYSMTLQRRISCHFSTAHPDAGPLVLMQKERDRDPGGSLGAIWTIATLCVTAPANVYRLRLEYPGRPFGVKGVKR